MSDFPSSSSFVARSRRWLAGGAAMLVLLLTAFAVSPQLHNWLHAGATETDDGCAIVLFSNGVSLTVGHIAVVPPSAEWQTTLLPSAPEIFLAPVRYLRQPERGPPLS